MLQNQPEFVHQFYSEASTMLRVDGNTRETASAMLVFYMKLLIYVWFYIYYRENFSYETENPGSFIDTNNELITWDLIYNA